jgi:DNA-binding transcriptional MerR regulator
MPEKLSLEDLEKHSGLSTRTLRYYMQVGLLPGPETLGKYAHYSQEHLDRLDLILILKELHLPLKEIRTVLDRLTPSEIIRYRDDQEDLLEKIKGVKPESEERGKAVQESSALNYIKGLEEAHTTHRNIADDRPNLYQNNQAVQFSDMSAVGRHQEPQRMEQEIWRRMVLTEGVELNIRETRDKEIRRKIERLVSFARSLFAK